MTRLALVFLLASASGASSLDSRFDVRVDPRVELEAVVELLAGPPHDTNGAARVEGPYRSAVLERFADFKDHPAVKTHAAIRSPKFGAIERVQTMLRLGGPPALEPVVPVAKEAGAWTGALRGFYKDSGFADWFPDAAKTFTPELGALRRDLAASDYLRTLEAYAGLPFEGRYGLYLSPARGGGSAGNGVEFLPDGSFLVGSVVGLDADRIAEIVWHEASHALLDTVADVGSSRVDLQACKLEYSIVSPK